MTRAPAPRATAPRAPASSAPRGRRPPPPAPQGADFVLVGGGIAAVTAAETLRDEGEAGSILILGAEPVQPYSRPSLIGGILTGERTIEQCLLRPPDAYAQAGIEVRTATRVVRVDPAQHLVFDQAGGALRYGKLLIATGARARRLAVPGAGLRGVLRLRELDDALALRRAALRDGAVTIIGTSFVAMEAATALSRMGLRVTLVDRAGAVFPKIDSPRLAAVFLERCRQHGIEVRLGERVVAFVADPADPSRLAGVALESGERLVCGTALLAIGAEPRTECLEGSGIAVDDGVLVDEFLCSAERDVFAAGDAARYLQADGRRIRTEHWENARTQGLTAARNMLGQRVPYEDVPHYFCDFLDFSFSFLGTSEGVEQRVLRGDIDTGSFAEFYLRGGRVIGAFSTGRPAEETGTVDLLIRERTEVGGALAWLADPSSDLAALARTTVLILQGGGALGAFECGVVRAMEEASILPLVVGGVSVGALNGAIVAANPGHAAEALDAFWDEIGLKGPGCLSSGFGHAVAAWGSMLFGVPGFFRPRWMAPPLPGEALPAQWTSLYDASPMVGLLQRYVDFDRLAASPIRLIVGAVDVQLGTLRFFDSRTERLTPAHILASCSLPPVFRWTTIDGRPYWDGGIVSNSPLEHVLETCGADNKDVVIVDLFPGARPLPTNLADVLTRYAEITYAERVRNDARLRELLREYRALVDEVMLAVEPQLAARLRERPRYVHLMGGGTGPAITRIVREGEEGQPLAADYDFSEQTIRRHREAGYAAATKRLAERTHHAPLPEETGHGDRARNDPDPARPPNGRAVDGAPAAAPAAAMGGGAAGRLWGGVGSSDSSLAAPGLARRP